MSYTQSYQTQQLLEGMVAVMVMAMGFGIMRPVMLQSGKLTKNQPYEMPKSWQWKDVVPPPPWVWDHEIKMEFIIDPERGSEAYPKEKRIVLNLIGFAPRIRCKLDFSPLPYLLAHEAAHVRLLHAEMDNMYEYYLQEVEAWQLVLKAYRSTSHEMKTKAVAKLSLGIYKTNLIFRARLLPENISRLDKEEVERLGFVIPEIVVQDR